MTKHATRRIIVGSTTFLTALTLTVATAAAGTSAPARTQGTSNTTSRTERGTVQGVDGNTVILKMSTGEVRAVTVDPKRIIVVDGKDTTVRDLKVGTQLTGVYTATTTTVIDRTVTKVTGTVWQVVGNTVIADVDGQAKQYTVKPDQMFDVDGKMVDVNGLKKGMKFSADKFTEEPRYEVALNTTVTGTYATTAAAMPPPASAKVAEPSAATSAPAPTRTGAGSSSSSSNTTGAGSGRLPKTASPVPLTGLLGLMFTGAGLALRRMRK